MTTREITPTEQQLIDAAAQAEAKAKSAYSAAFDYREKHGELSEHHKQRLEQTAVAWDQSRIALDNYRYTTYGPY